VAEAAEPESVELAWAEGPGIGVPVAAEVDVPVTTEQAPVSAELEPEPIEVTDDGGAGTSDTTAAEGVADAEPLAVAPESGEPVAASDPEPVVSEAPPASMGSVHFGAVHGWSEPAPDRDEVEIDQAGEPPRPAEESAPIEMEPVAEGEVQPEAEPLPVVALRLEDEEYLPLEHGWVSSTDWSDPPEQDHLAQVEEEASPVAQAVEQPQLEMEEVAAPSTPEAESLGAEPIEETAEVLGVHGGPEPIAEATAPEVEPEPVAAAVAVEQVADEGTEAPVPAESEDSVEVVDGAFEEEEAAEVPDAAAEIEPELVITETMAEVFLRQGHRPLALAVYAQLLEREPHNQRLLEAVARLRGELLETLVPEPRARTAPEPEEPVGSFLARVLGPEMLQDEPPLAIDPGPFGGRPTRPAEDPSLSLSTIFGEDSRRRGTSAEGAGSGVGNAEPSFDEFFGAERVPAGAGGDEAELEQFNAWLRSLQR